VAIGDDAFEPAKAAPASMVSTVIGRERGPPLETGPWLASMPEPGGQVGRHLILRVLGRGAMGVVFQAYDPELDRRIAVKLLRPERSAAESATDEEGSLHDT